MERIKPRTLSGFAELLPEQQLQFQAVMATLEQVYRQYGFYPLDTPVLEYAEVLLAKGGGETEKQIYRFSKGDTDLAMRFDLTVPLAKYVALYYPQLHFPFRRYQIGKVYRGERAQRGRFREFYQADIDIIGDGALDILNEAEIPSIIYRTFQTLGLNRFKIRINNRKLLSGFFQLLGAAGQAGDMMRIIDKLDKIGLSAVQKELGELGLAPAAIHELCAFISCKGETAVILQALQRYRGKNELFDTGLQELTTVAEAIAAFGVPEENFGIDLTIARGLDYYTGTVYETTLLDHPEIGSICSGGRYDNLAGYYTDRQLPGVGISIGLTRLFYILNEKNYIDSSSVPSNVDVLLLPMEGAMHEAISLSTQMRDAGLRVQIHYEKKKFKAKMAYADRLQIPYVAILGEDEIAAQAVGLKNMATGEQQTLPYLQAIAYLQKAVKAATGKKIISDPIS